MSNLIVKFLISLLVVALLASGLTYCYVSRRSAETGRSVARERDGRIDRMEREALR